MSHATHRQAIQALFTRIAGRYDLLNRLMTAGQDLRWRREAIRFAGLRPGERVLDLGAGTGDLALEALHQAPGVQVVLADCTLAMMRVGCLRLGSVGLAWTGADALCLPFPQASFDAVVSGFLMRNVADVSQALAEQSRVLKPGGRVVILDTTPPTQNIFALLVRFHLRVVIPLLGRLIARQAEAYAYLPASTQGFMPADRLADSLRAAGFCEVRYIRRMLGVIAIHRGQKGQASPLDGQGLLLFA